MALHKLLNNFTGGEITPQLDARIDLQKYDSSCRKMENMRPMPWGGATFRTGTLYVAAAKFADKPCRLFPVNVSTTTGYVLEAGENYIRFHQDGSPVTYSDAEAWTVGVYYPIGAIVKVGAGLWRCLYAHVGGTGGATFAFEQATLLMWFGVTGQPNTPYEIATNFAASELSEVQFSEINDVVYMVHPSHPPVKVSRYAHTSWEHTTVAYKYPVLLDENADETKTLQIPAIVATGTASGKKYRIVTVGTTDFTLIGAASNTVGLEFTASGAATGNGTVFQLSGTGAALVASFDAFTSTNIGSYYEIRHQRDATKVELDVSVSTPGTTTSEWIKVKGDWTMVTTERWYGTLNIQRSTDGGTTARTIRTFTSAADRNVNASGTQDTEALFRLQFICTGDPYGSPPWTGTVPTTYVKARATFEVGDAYIAGLVIVTGFTDSMHVTCTIVNPVENETATDIWTEGAFSDRRGYPRAIGVFEQRVFYAGTQWRPTTVWGSVVADFDNFTFSDLDDAAVAYQLASAQQNPIQWLHSLLRLNAGTSGGEHIIASGNLEEPLTPSNVAVRDPSSYGSEHMQALKVDNCLLFLQRQGKRIREVRETNPYASSSDYVSPDLTLLAEHITSGGITQMDFARLPDPQVFVVMTDGTLGVMTYNKEQNINAWCRYTTLGSFESVATVYGSPSDVVYVAVNRIIGGQTVRYIEVFTGFDPSTQQPKDGVFMDAAIVYDDVPATVITGLAPLEGQRVQVLADGAPVGNAFTGVDALVVTGGQITLPFAASRVNVGLPYAGELRPRYVDQQLGNGTSQGRRRRISELVIRFKDSLGGYAGNANRYAPELGQFMEEMTMRHTDSLMDTPPDVFTGDYPIPWAAGPDFNGEICVGQQQPLPMTVLGLFAKMEVFGE